MVGPHSFAILPKYIISLLLKLLYSALLNKMKSKEIPTVEQLLIPTLQALEALGGTNTVENMNNEVCQILRISQENRQIKTKKNGKLSQIEYNLSLARYHLSNIGYLEKLPSKEWKLSITSCEAEDPLEILEKSRQKRIERFNQVQGKNHTPIDNPVNSNEYVHPDFRPKRKPSILMEVIASIILYGPTFLVVYFLTTWISGCIRDSF